MLKANVEPGLELRLLDLHDAPALFAMIEANRGYLRTWLPWVDANSEVTHSEEFIMMSRRQFADREGLPLGIFLDGAVVGTIGCNSFDWGADSAEIGYWLSQDATGRGIVTKCCRVLIDHLINTLGINRVVIRAATNNVTSRAIPERLGFTLEGVMRQVTRQNGELIDLALYSLLAAEWNASD